MEKMYETFTVEQEVLDKWMPLLEGTGKWESFVSTCPKLDNMDYATVAQLLENTEELKERTNAAAGTGDFSPILIPMLRRVMPALIGMSIFGTQPMSGPTGLIFALRAAFHNDTVNPITRAVGIIFTLDEAATADFTVGGDFSVTADEMTGKVRHIEGANMLCEITSGTKNIAYTGEIDNAAAFNAKEASVVVSYDNEALQKIIFSNYTGTMSTATGEDLSTTMKEVGFNIETATVTAKTRKLKAKWTEELEQDLMAIHNMNAERLLTSIASDEIVVEMNREFIALIAAKAGTSTSWDFDATTAGETGRWEMEKYQTLMAHIARQKRKLAVTNRRGMANFCIVSPGVLSVIEAAGKLTTENVDPVKTSYAGKALNMDCYVDIYATDDKMHLGYKGPNEIDAGIYYAPYIPLQIKKGYGEEDGQPRTFFHTRYGVADNLFGAGDYYHAIDVQNLPE
jgi:hypothetical protein